MESTATQGSSPSTSTRSLPMRKSGNRETRGEGCHCRKSQKPCQNYSAHGTRALIIPGYRYKPIWLWKERKNPFGTEGLSEPLTTERRAESPQKNFVRDKELILFKNNREVSCLSPPGWQTQSNKQQWYTCEGKETMETNSL